MQLLNKRYKLKKILGEGGMGRVYLAIDQKKRQQVAIKECIIPKQEQLKIKRVKHEYHFMKKLEHPCIIKAFDFFILQGKYFIVMEYVQGMTLQDFICNKPYSVSFEKQLGIAQKICDAVAELNKNGIIHRDIKPSNIILTGDDLNPKLLDLGLAKSINNEFGALTQTGNIVGTADYMSPEQADGNLKVGKYTDVFALGVVLYQFFSWKKNSPFYAGNIISTMNNIFYLEVPLLSEVVKEKNPKFTTVTHTINCALKKDPKDRIPSAKKMLAMLQKRYTQRTPNKELLENFTSEKTVVLSYDQPKIPHPTTKVSPTAKTSKRTKKPSYTMRSTRQKKTQNTSNHIISVLVIILLSICAFFFIESTEDSSLQQVAKKIEDGEFVITCDKYYEILIQNWEEDIFIRLTNILHLWVRKANQDQKELQNIQNYIGKVENSFPDKIKELGVIKYSISKQLSKIQQTQKIARLQVEKDILTALEKQMQKKNFAQRWNAYDSLLKQKNPRSDIAKIIRKKQQYLEQKIIQQCQTIINFLEKDTSAKHWILRDDNWQLITTKINPMNSDLAHITLHITQLFHQQKERSVEKKKSLQKKPLENENIQIFSQEQWLAFRQEKYFSLIIKRQFNNLKSKIEEFEEPLQQKDLLDSIDEILLMKKLTKIMQQEIKKKSSISITLINGKFLKGQIMKTTGKSFTLRDYKKEKYEVFYKDIKAREIPKLVSLDKDMFLAMGILLLAEKDFKYSKIYLQKSSSSRKKLYLKILEEHRPKPELDFIIIEPISLAKSPYLTVPAHQSTLLIQGRVSKNIKKITVKTKNKKTILTIDDQGIFNYQPELKYGVNFLQLNAKHSRNRDIQHNWKIKRKLSITLPTFQGGWGRNGYFAENSRSKPRKVKWKFKSSGFITGSPVIKDNYIYFMNGEGVFYALDKRNGKKIWSYPTEHGSYSHPTIYKDTIYIGAKNKVLYAFRAKTGQLKWTFQANRRIQGAPVIYKDILYFSANALYAINTQTGKEIWKKESVRPFYASPALLGKRLYVAASGSSALHCFDLNTPSKPKILWTFPFKGDYSIGCSIYNETVYFGCNKGIFAVSAKTGKLKWKFESNDIRSHPAVYNNTVYIGCGKTLQALDAKDGYSKWSFSVSQKIAEATIVTPKAIYFGSHDHHFYTLNEKGQQISKFKTGGKIYAGATIENDVLYFGSGDKYFYALD